MAQLSTKIKLYLDREIDFTKDVILQDDRISGVPNPYIKEWNVEEAQPTQEQLDALNASATTEDNNNKVIQTRKSLYGKTYSQLEYIVENGVDAFIAKQNQIKLDNPKS